MPERLLKSSYYKRVVELIESGLTQREIATALRISERTMYSIIRNSQVGTYDEYIGTTPERCQKCGGLVYKPCRLCHIREYTEREKIIRKRHVQNPSCITLPHSPRIST